MLSQILEEKIWTGSHLPAHKSSQQDGIQRHTHHGVRTIKISNRHVIPVSSYFSTLKTSIQNICRFKIDLDR